MPAKWIPGVSIERDIWRGGGVVLAIEAVKLIASMPLPGAEEKYIEYMAVGLAIPVWAILGESKGWFIEDVNRATSFVKNKILPKR